MNPNHDKAEEQSHWNPASCSPLDGRASGAGVERWHLDSVEFNAHSRSFRVRGWVVSTQPEPPVHVIVAHSGGWSSYLANELRPDVVDKLRANEAGVPGEPWCGFFLEVPAPDSFDLGFERNGSIAWLRRCRAPASNPSPPFAAAPGSAGAGEARILAVAERHHGVGQARLVGSHEPQDSRKGRVVVHEVELGSGSASTRIKLVEKRDPTPHELAVVRRLRGAASKARAGSFVPVLEVSEATHPRGWFICGFVEPQLDMYLDPMPYVDALVTAARRMNEEFADLAGESRSQAAMDVFRQAVATLAVVDERLGTRAAGALESALPALETLPTVASHNDFYWNNLGLERDDEGKWIVRMFDLELVGPNIMGAEFHQFARMVMESASFRAPFDRLIEAYAQVAGVDAPRLRVAALAYALVRSGMRLRSGVPLPKRSDGSPRCEEPDAFSGIASWLALETGKLTG